VWNVKRTRSQFHQRVAWHTSGIAWLTCHERTHESNGKLRMTLSMWLLVPWKSNKLADNHILKNLKINVTLIFGNTIKMTFKKSCTFITKKKKDYSTLKSLILKLFIVSVLIDMARKSFFFFNYTQRTLHSMPGILSLLTYAQRVYLKLLLQHVCMYFYIPHISHSLMAVCYGPPSPPKIQTLQTL